MPLVKIKSNPPKNKPTSKLTVMTTSVNRMVSCRVGHATFLSSSRVSLRKPTGVVAIKKSQTSKIKSKRFEFCDLGFEIFYQKLVDM